MTPDHTDPEWACALLSTDAGLLIPARAIRQR